VKASPISIDFFLTNANCNEAGRAYAGSGRSQLAWSRSGLAALRAVCGYGQCCSEDLGSGVYIYFSTVIAGKSVIIYVSAIDVTASTASSHRERLTDSRVRRLLQSGAATPAAPGWKPAPPPGPPPHMRMEDPVHFHAGDAATNSHTHRADDVHHAAASDNLGADQVQHEYAADASWPSQSHPLQPPPVHGHDGDTIYAPSEASIAASDLTASRHSTPYMLTPSHAQTVVNHAQHAAAAPTAMSEAMKLSHDVITAAAGGSTSGIEPVHAAAVSSHTVNYDGDEDDQSRENPNAGPARANQQIGGGSINLSFNSIFTKLGVSVAEDGAVTHLLPHEADSSLGRILAFVGTVLASAPFAGYLQQHTGPLFSQCLLPASVAGYMGSYLPSDQLQSLQKYLRNHIEEAVERVFRSASSFSIHLSPTLKDSRMFALQAALHKRYPLLASEGVSGAFRDKQPVFYLTEGSPVFPALDRLVWDLYLTAQSFRIIPLRVRGRGAAAGASTGTPSSPVLGPTIAALHAETGRDPNTGNGQHANGAEDDAYTFPSYCMG